jgi:drug/metabolite transporter (DMT)-like permease
MITVLLGLSGALAYGFADFAGGLAARRRSPVVVTALTSSIGIAPLLIGLVVLGGQFTPHAIFWGVVAGLSGSVAVLLLYAVLATGPMSVLSPVTSVFSAILPVVVAVSLGTRLSPLAVIAIVVAVVAVVLVSAAKDTSGARLTRRGLVMAVIAGCGFGGIVLAYGQTSTADGVAPLVVARVMQGVLMTGIVLVARARRRARPEKPRARPTGRFWLTVIACGVLDATANVFIQAALHSNPDPANLPVVSVLNALYPVGTIILAGVVLRERLTRIQIGGIGLGIAASVVLALT